MQIIDGELDLPEDARSLFHFYHQVGFRPTLYWCRDCNWIFVGVEPLDTALVLGMSMTHRGHTMDILQESYGEATTG